MHTGLRSWPIAAHIASRAPLPLALPSDQSVVAHSEIVTFRGVGISPDRDFAVVFPGGQTEAALVRIHSACVTGDLLGSQRCDCGQQLRHALEVLAKSGGVLLYLDQEGRGVGLSAKLSAYNLQDGGLDTFAANRALGLRDDARDYSGAATMLRLLGLSNIRLVTNNPDKVEALSRFGIDVRERVGTPTFQTQHNRAYLGAKRAMGHFLSEVAP